MRRPKSRRPRKLPDPHALRERERLLNPPPRKKDKPRERLKSSHVTGASRMGREEVSNMARSVARGETRVLLGLDPFDGLTPDDVYAALDAMWGWDHASTRSSIDPDLTVEAAVGAFTRIAEVARAGGRIALATGRPASMLSFYQRIARTARDAGARVLTCDDAGRFTAAGRSQQRLWWLDGVAVITDGYDIVADDALHAGDEMLFAVGRAELVVADRGFAGHALRDGYDVVAFADLDAVALGVAAWRGLPVNLVPMGEGKPPDGYELLADLALDTSFAASLSGVPPRLPALFNALDPDREHSSGTGRDARTPGGSARVPEAAVPVVAAIQPTPIAGAIDRESSSD
jgi:Phosphatase